MPTVHREMGCDFIFYATDRDEPPHIHVVRERGRDRAKVWLQPIQLASARGFAAHELTDILEIVQREGEAFRRRWDAYFGS